jgi:uncharacterized membrane protein
MDRNAFLAGTQKTRGRMLLMAAAAAILAALVSLGSSLTPSAGAEPADGAGYRDFSYSNTADKSTTGPTSEKPQSKLWFNDGAWWGVMFNRTAEEYRIYRYDRSAHQWSDTGTVVDERNNSKADALWDGGRLYVATAGQNRTNSADAARILRYSYDPGTKRYSLLIPAFR